MIAALPIALTQPPVVVVRSSPGMAVTASAFAGAFAKDAQAATLRFLGHRLDLSGTVVARRTDRKWVWLTVRNLDGPPARLGFDARTLGGGALSLVIGTVVSARCTLFNGTRTPPEATDCAVTGAAPS